MYHMLYIKQKQFKTHGKRISRNLHIQDDDSFSKYYKGPVGT